LRQGLNEIDASLVPAKGGEVGDDRPGATEFFWNPPRVAALDVAGIETLGDRVKPEASKPTESRKSLSISVWTMIAWHCLSSSICCGRL
jgi:hypothetical protein